MREEIRVYEDGVGRDLNRRGWLDGGIGGIGGRGLLDGGVGGG